MKRVLFVALIVVISGGCKKTMDKLEDSAYQPAGGAGQGTGGSGGAPQAVRGAVNRVVTAAELHDLHLFMKNAQLASGRVPNSTETWAALTQPGGNQKLVQLIQDGLLILVPNPGEEGLWAYSKEAPTQGGWVLTHSEPRRVTPQEFAQLQRN
jgi:hypothetical protein